MGKVTDGFSPEKLNAIFHHPDCRKLFEDKANALTISKSTNSQLLHDSLNLFIKDISFTQLNLTEKEFYDLMDKLLWEVHTGTVLLVIRFIRNTPFKYFIDGGFTPYSVISATYQVEKEIQELIAPVKAETIDEFWEKATIVQMNEVNRVINNVNKQMKASENKTLQL